MGLEFLPDHIGEVLLPTDRQSISEWSVYLPSDVDRNKYIDSCFLTGTVTLTNTNAEVKHRVRIGTSALREIKFPVDANDLGSEVICVTSPFSGKLFVVDVFDPITAYTAQKENQFRLSKTTKNGYADFVLDGDKGVVQIGVRSEQNGGIVSVNISNANSNAQLKINVNGTAVLNTTDAVTIDAPKIVLNKGKEPVTLADTLVQLLSDLITEISQSLVSTAIGQQPLINANKIAAYKDKLDTIKSKITFTS